MQDVNQPAILIGPFKEILTMDHLPLKGPLNDTALEIIHNGAILVEKERILEIAPFEQLAKIRQYFVQEITEPLVCLPGFVDAHTHLCWAGSRARDYALRVAGTPYLEIARRGGGILDTVSKTRHATPEALESSLAQRCDRHLSEGVTTVEVKSGYGLNVQDELKMLRVIRKVNRRHPADLVATCLAAHVPPKDFQGSASEYLDYIAKDLLPQVWKGGLARRVDIFIEESAFTVEEARRYLTKARQMGFSLTMHVDQFTPGSSLLAVELQAASADHLESSTVREIIVLGQSGVSGVVLPGASLGLGLPYAPARQLLDEGAAIAIASDWNPGSAPMGDLLLQAALIGAAEKLSEAETFAGITFRAAKALELPDRGVLAAGKLADLLAFPGHDYREILYQQGKLKPCRVWKGGEQVLPR